MLNRVREDKKEKQCANKFGCKGKEAEGRRRDGKRQKAQCQGILSEFERNNSRVSPKTDIRERKYNSKSEELQERVHYFIYCLRDSLG